MSMRFDIMTLFPSMLAPFFDESILGRAADAGILSVVLHNIRDYTQNKHRRTDDIPFGGGKGMVMTPQPIVDCHAAIPKCGRYRTIYLTPQGTLFDQEKAKALSLGYDQLILLCGHYEGIDQRAIDLVADEELSIGDYILTGGELGAAVIVDAVSRLIPGVLADAVCYEDESLEDGLLEYPQYTRPRNFRGLVVPEVLLNGNHAKINAWRRERALDKTIRVRPDLLARADLTDGDKKDIGQAARQQDGEAKALQAGFNPSAESGRMGGIGHE